jgi:hypothetical protein
MVMNKAFRFIKNVFAGSEANPPEKCRRALLTDFEGARNIEWFKNDGSFEAVFYKNNIEYIAVFSITGSLLEYKMYLPFDFLPLPLKKVLDQKGEIMNIVLVNKRNRIIFEAIYRDTALNRYMILLSEFGQIIEEKPL